MPRNASASARLSRLAGKRPVEKAAVGRVAHAPYQIVEVLCDAERPGQMALVKFDDGETDWVNPADIPLRLD